MAGKKLRLYGEYDTKSHGRVKLLRYKDATPEKRKVCKADGNPLDYFFIPESEFIPHERQRKRPVSPKKPPVEAQREFHAEMVKKGFRPKTFYISRSNTKKLEKLKEESGLTWNDFMNDLIKQL